MGIWRYIQIENLEQAEENEEICAVYENPMKNTSGMKNSAEMKAAEKDAKDGKCELVVWREEKEEKNDINKLKEKLEESAMFYKNLAAYQNEKGVKAKSENIRQYYSITSSYNTGKAEGMIEALVFLKKHLE